MSSPVRARVTVLLSLIALVMGLVAAPVTAAKTAPDKPSASKAILFGSDGMRPDLMEKYARQGQMPTFADLMRKGVRGDNGMVQAFPPNTGVGWYSMATGTYPSEHGSTNNTFFRGGDTFTNSTSFAAPGVLQADTIANAAERSGKRVAQLDWVGGRAAGIAGPTVDFANFFSTRGVLAAPLNTTEQSGAATFGVSYQVATFTAAGGWTNVPLGDPAAPPRQSVLTIASTFAAQNPTRSYDVYVFDSIVNGIAAYDRVLLVRTSALPPKDGAQAAADLAVGDFEEIKLTGTDGLIGTRAGQTAGFYTKLVSLASDLSSFKLYFTSVQRVIATCSTAACDALPAGGTGENRFEKYIAEHFPTFIAADFAPLEARIIDEDTYVQQGRELQRAYASAVLRYVLGTLQPDTDLAMVGYPVTDEFSHQFMGLYTRTDMDGNPNPYYDDVNGDGTADGRVAIREGYVRSAYHEADARLGLTRSFMGAKAAVFAASDHGFAPQWWAVNARRVLFDQTVNGISLSASSANATSNCRPALTDLTKACWAGGTIQVYINPGQLFDRTARPTAPTYEQVRAAITSAFQNLTDPARPSAQVVDRIIQKEELRNVDGSDSLHPNRSGDVVIALRPPYQSDASTPGKRIAFSEFFGQHGYLPELVDIAHNVNMHATFVAAGPGIRRQGPVKGIRAIDLAPTLSFLLGIDGPQNARGKILVNLTTRPSLKVYSILNISDFHGQLVPLSETADSVGPSFAIGGAAYLKPWFDTYRAESQDGSITVAGGDSIGATPPISNSFGDRPTIELMNAMGFSADALGNHNFDRGSAYFRNVIVPLARFPYLSANVVDASGRTPAEWKPSQVFSFEGAKIGVVGFTNEDAPSLVAPGAFDPFHVVARRPVVQAEVNRLRARGIQTIVVLGHDGATLGSLTNPSGPLLTLADSLTGVDAVIGDHTDFQVVSRRSNGILVTENRSKGIRFTRLRFVVDPATKTAVYTTADFHKPWNIGVAPNAAIQTRIDDLNNQLRPILGVVIGNSKKAIPRADACGQSAGRTCESLVGNVVTDALLATYKAAPFLSEIAITNSGGLRADLTCPTTDNPSDFCPSFTPPPYPISRGQVSTVLPFGNEAATLTVNGAELKAMLEQGVAAMPNVSGAFPQVAGICFSYNIEAAPLSRVTTAVRADSAGNCTSTPVSLSAAVNYKIVLNDFTAGGGDGYPDFSSRMTTQALLDQVVADYIQAQSVPLNPFVRAAPDGRINCFDPNPGSGVTSDCPTLIPSPPVP